MVNKKYIVKNCPCLSMAEYPSGKVEDNLCGLTITQYCKDCTNCLIKQVIEKCNKCIDENYPDYYDEGFEEDIVTEFTNDILQLFEIKEVNNDR